MMKKLSRRKFIPTAFTIGLGGALGLDRAWGASGPVKVRLGTLAPRGSSYTKHLQLMGEQWRQAPGGGVALTVYSDGTMGSEPDMVRRMRLGQLQAAMVTTTGLAEIDLAAAGLQSMPMMFRTLEELDFVESKLEPLLEKRLEQKGFIVLFWADSGWVRFFSKKPVLHPGDLKTAKLFVTSGRPAEENIYRSAGYNPVALEVADILPGLQTGLLDAVPMPPTIALATQLDTAAPHMLDLVWVPLVGAAIMSKKVWETIPSEGREAIRKAALEAGRLIKADSRRESVESVQAMAKRGLKVQKVTPEVEAEWLRTVEPVWPKIRGSIVPPDIFDEVVNQLKIFRSGQSDKK
jgi:TRAP-type C4-dicarboxylate transport system substrate-binding protein